MRSASIIVTSGLVFATVGGALALRHSGELGASAPRTFADERAGPSGTADMTLPLRVRAHERFTLGPQASGWFAVSVSNRGASPVTIVRRDASGATALVTLGALSTFSTSFAPGQAMLVQHPSNGKPLSASLDARLELSVWGDTRTPMGLRPIAPSAVE